MKKLWVVILLFSVISCTNTGNNTSLYQNIIPIKEHNWQRFDKLEYNIPVTKGDSLDFYFIFKYNADYKSNKIPVNITFYTPGGETRSRNFSFQLVDRKNKKKLGTTENHITSITLPIRKEMPFITDGTCKIIVEKKIPKVDTYGIVEVGIKAVRSEAKKTNKDK